MTRRWPDGRDTTVVASEGCVVGRFLDEGSRLRVRTEGCEGKVRIAFAAEGATAPAATP